MEIRCQEEECPYGKQVGQRCIFGELLVKEDNKGQEISERHKCPKAKQGKLQYVDITLKIA